MTGRPFLAALVIAFLLLLLVLMYVGWRRRQRRQSHIPRPLAVPPDPGSPSLRAEVFYVATTIADAPLDRVAVGGLGFRGRAAVAVYPGGVMLAIDGEPDAWLPRAAIARVDRSTATIDRVVERGGLVRIGWRLGDTDVDTYLRATEPEQQAPLIAAIAELAPRPSGNIANEGL